MNWDVKYLPEALEDFRKLDGSQKILIRKAIQKVLKIKLRGAGLRIVYQLIRCDNDILIVVIGICEDEEVYEIAQKRINKHDL